MLAHGQMLRGSVEAIGGRVDVRAITDPAVDPLIEGGIELVAFTDAVLIGDERDRSDAARAVSDGLGPAALCDAAGVVATFEMMNRIAEATGMPVTRSQIDATTEFRQLTGIDAFRHD